MKPLRPAITRKITPFVWVIPTTLLVFLAATACGMNAKAASRYIRSSPSNSGVIIFVHGATGDATSTWTNGATGAYWPDLLAQDQTFAGTDIYVYEYPTPALSKAMSINELAENMRARLLGDDVLRHDNVAFLAHSMGGILVRDFLVKYRSGNFKFAQKVRFVYFSATPTEGTPYAQLAGLVSQNRQLRGLYPMVDSDSYLADLQRNWLSADLNIPSYCSYERQAYLGQIVVDQRSASNGCTKAIDPVDANHIDIVKPESANSLIHVAFRNAFRQEMLPHIKKGTVDRAQKLVAVSTSFFDSLICVRLHNYYARQFGGQIEQNEIVTPEYRPSLDELKVINYRNNIHFALCGSIDFDGVDGRIRKVIVDLLSALEGYADSLHILWTPKGRNSALPARSTSEEFMKLVNQRGAALDELVRNHSIEFRLPEPKPPSLAILRRYARDTARDYSGYMSWKEQINFPDVR